MYPTDPLEILGLWTSMILILMIFSYLLYKETPIYRLAEHLFVGVAFAVTAITAIDTTIKVAIIPLTRGEIVYVIPIILGILLYTMFTRKYRWLSRFSLAALVGSMIGLAMRGVLIPNILQQVISTITPPKSDDPLSWFNMLFIGVGTFCCLSYFLLTHEHRGLWAYPTRLGRWIMMLGLGVMFGNTVLMRMAMLSGVAERILQVLKIIPM
ncbi:MAG: hypothetical protein QXH67_00505 [Candidatus Bathyarchaeia archaeon]